MTVRPGYVIALSSIRRNETSPLVRHKTFNYGDSMLAKRQARAEGIDEPIFCNMQGQLTEGAVSNLFFIKKRAALYAARKGRITARHHPVLSLSML
jgi:4-amino-4-deoxychorismate lyase